jgi:hypothetical protein
MTIAIGLMYGEGIVLGSDTEEVVSGYLKRPHNKAMFREGPGGSLVVIGAGNAGYVDSFVNGLLDYRAHYPEDLEPFLSTRLCEFYAAHVLPFASYPAHERPEIELLMASAGKDRTPQLWATEKTALRPAWDWEAIGIGAMYARSLLANLKLERRSVGATLAQLVVAYAIFKVKDLIDGCGRLTTIQHLGAAGRVEYVDAGRIEAWERQFARIERASVTSLLFALGDEADDVGATKMTTALEHIRAALKRLPVKYGDLD